MLQICAKSTCKKQTFLYLAIYLPIRDKAMMVSRCITSRKRMNVFLEQEKNLCLTYQYEIFHTHMWMQKMTDESYQMAFVSWISEEN